VAAHPIAAEVERHVLNPLRLPRDDLAAHRRVDGAVELGEVELDPCELSW